MYKAPGTVSGHNRFSIGCHSTFHQGQERRAAAATQQVRLHLLFDICEPSAPAAHLHPAFRKELTVLPSPPSRTELSASCRFQGSYSWDPDSSYCC